MAVQGRLNQDGEFDVTEWELPKMPLNAGSLGEGYVAIVSGLAIGRSALTFQLLIDYLTGVIGTDQVRSYQAWHNECRTLQATSSA